MRSDFTVSGSVVDRSENIQNRVDGVTPLPSVLARIPNPFDSRALFVEKILNLV